MNLKEDIYKKMKSGCKMLLWYFKDFMKYISTILKPKTYNAFCTSAYYNAFVKFGRYIMHINPLYPEKYIDYVILSKIKLDHWARDDLYEAYLIDTLKVEPVEAALQKKYSYNDGLGRRTKCTMV